MGIMVYPYLWVMQDLYYPLYYRVLYRNPVKGSSLRPFRGSGHIEAQTPNPLQTLNPKPTTTALSLKQIMPCRTSAAFAESEACDFAGLRALRADQP